MGGSVFPPCSFASAQNMVGIMAVMGTSFKRTYACTSQSSQECCIPCPWACSRPLSTHMSSRDSWTLTGKSGSVSCGVTAPFACALQQSVSPVLWKFCNQIPLAFKVKFPGGSQSLCWIPRLGNLLWALELLQQYKNFFAIIALQFVGHLLGGSVAGIMVTSSKRTYATCNTSQVCCSQRPCPLGRPLLTSASTGDTHTQRQVWISLSWDSLCLGHLLVDCCNSNEYDESN